MPRPHCARYRMTGTSRLSLRMFQGSRGEHFYQNVLQATTKLGGGVVPIKLRPDLERRETELKRLGCLLGRRDLESFDVQALPWDC